MIKVNKRLFIFTAVLLVLSYTLLGCGDQPRSGGRVEGGIKRILPEATIVAVDTQKNKGKYEEHETRLYTVKINEVQFVYQEYPSPVDPLFGGGITYRSSNDYCKRLMNAFFHEITNISKKYDVEIEGQTSGITITNHLRSMEEIENGLNALQEIYILLEEYIPRKTLGWFDFSIKLGTVYAPELSLKLETEIKNSAEWDFEWERELLYFEFKDYVAQGLVKDIELSTDLLRSIPTKGINTLYIDGEAYVSERYDTEFIYNLGDKSYYTRVCFGTDIVYNGGVEDYLQREIIEKYYPDANYTINDFKGISTYQIGTDLYKIQRKKDRLIFKKNRKTLDINNYTIISDTSTGAAYYYWISASDFASIMGMTVEKIDDTGVCLTWQKD